MKRILALILVLFVILTACNKNTKVPNRPVYDFTQLSLEASLEYSKALGDEIVAYYLCKDIDESYRVPLLEVGTILPPSRQIEFSSEGTSHIMYYLRTAVDYSTTLPGSPYYSEDNISETLDKTVVAKLKKYIFTEGTAPNIRPTDINMQISPDFVTWFMDKAKTTGFLDNRVTVIFGDTLQLTVNSSDCDHPKGLDFNILGTIYTLNTSEVGITMEEVRQSPTYNVVLHSYSYYDSGLYVAKYITDANAGALDTVEITVSFRHSRSITGNFDSELNEFLAGVTQIRVRHN